MTTRSMLRATMIAIAAVLLVAPAVVADTCCANLPVGLDPRSAMPGDVVRITGLQCRNSDNTGPLPLKLGAFWLSTARRPAQSDPGSVPGDGLSPPDLPPVETWHAFASVPDPKATAGDATIIVPDLPGGTYQLWWWCKGSGPGGGIHFSTGPRLAVGGAPDTATEAAGSVSTPGTPGWPLELVMAFWAAVLVGIIRWGPFGPRAHKVSAE